MSGSSQKNDSAKLKKLALDNGCNNLKKVELMPLWYALKVDVNSTGNALEMANLFYETGLFARVDPGFMLDFKPACSTEPNFNEQWGLNTNVAGEYDINLCQAWAITKGSPNVIVAVYDSGIDTTGTEFMGRLHHKSFDSQYLFNYVYYRNDLGNKDHGTNVASVIAANENNSLMVGVAPNVKLMNISHSFGFPENATVHHAKDISFAWRNGAHIINNSWGDEGGNQYDNLHSEILEDAIDSALVHGRGGLGTIIVFSSGNFNQSTVEYPGSYRPELLVVGASNRQGQRAIFPEPNRASSYGSGLDLVAPGLGIPVVNKGNVYVSSINGTSFAAPHVSGVAALVLSRNPQLSRQQVTDIIELTALKVGGYNYQNTVGRPYGTWHNEVGYGLLDAHAAVANATCPPTLYYQNTTFPNFHISISRGYIWVLWLI
ncbi:MAG: S8 family serine peptidase [Cytophagales bacterium]|nr:S8 family serine peptidase [Cytophagales bacterium]